MVVLAPLADVAIALLLLLLAFAALYIIKTITNTFQGAPWPVDWIISHILSAATSVALNVKNWALIGIDEAMTLFRAIFHIPITLFDEVCTALEQLPDAFARVRAAMTWLYQEARNYTTLTADGIAASVIATTHYLEALIDQARTAAVSEVSELATAVEGDVRSLTATIEGDVRSLTATIDTEVAEAERYAEDIVAEAERIAAASLATAAAGLEGTIAAGQRDVIDWVEGLVKGLDTAIDGAKAEAALGISAAVAGVLAWVRAGVMATVATINTELDDCVRPNCSWMGQLGRTFSTLASIAEVALIMAFLAECVATPGAAATQIETVVAPITQVTYEGVAALLSL